MKHFLLLSLIVACSSCKVRMDPSTAAFAAGDKTLAMSACGAVPTGGMDVCRVTEGSQISQDWVLVFPKPLISGEVRVRYRDTVKVYAVNDIILRIPWKELIGHDVWALNDEAPAQALASIQFKGSETAEFTDMLGIAFPIVLQKGYSPMPLDSGVSAFQTKCTIQYSTAGRSAISCN